MGHPQRSRWTPFGLIAPLFRLEASPPRHFRDRLAEQSKVAVAMKRLGVGMVDRILQVLFEILKSKPHRIDRPAQKRLFH